jgi:hypothetical protein
MPGLVPGIHVFEAAKQDVDGRVKPGHDGTCFGHMPGDARTTTSAPRNEQARTALQTQSGRTPDY